MADEKFDILFTLLRLKSFLMSMIIDEDDCSENFDYTIEYLERLFPDQREVVIEELKKSGIKSDCDIIFDQKVHLKFKEIASRYNPKQDLNKLLEEINIKYNLSNQEKHIEKFRVNRDENLREISENLLALIKFWALHRDLEHDVDQLSTLENENVIRPKEETQLEYLGESYEISYYNLSKLTLKYIELLTDYFFKYGGNLSLADFVIQLDKTKNKVSLKYSDLLKKHGFNQNENS